MKLKIHDYLIKSNINCRSNKLFFLLLAFLAFAKVNAQILDPVKWSTSIKKISETGISETFNASELGLELLNYKHVCISALKRSDKVVGYFLGFKNSRLTISDTALLEELAKENAA